MLKKTYEVPGIIDSDNDRDRVKEWHDFFWSKYKNPTDIQIGIFFDKLKELRTKGKLFLSANEFYFNSDSGKRLFSSEIDKFYKWHFGIKSDKNDEFEIVLNPNGFPNIFKKSLDRIDLGILNNEQQKYISRVCAEINDENSHNYSEKLLEENRIIGIVMREHCNELDNFITNQTDDILLNYGATHIIYSYLDTYYFNRSISDLVWGRKPIITEYENGYYDIADEFLAKRYALLINYLKPTINQVNHKNADLSYEYIVWQSLISVAIDYYSKEFSEKHNGKYSSINEVAQEISKEGACTNFEFMQAVYYLLKENLSSQNFFDAYDKLLKAYEDAQKNSVQNAFNQSLLEKRIQANITIDDIDMMSGVEFENFLKDYFEKRGYLATTTKASGDQGIDVIIEKNAVKTGIQAKCYSGTVGNSAIQEAVAGKKFYNCDKVMVITNNFFTDSAIALAKVNDVVLWDRNILKEKL